MGIASLASDSVPNITFTPQEPLVELLKVSLAKDAVLVMASAQVNLLVITIGSPVINDHYYQNGLINVWI